MMIKIKRYESRHIRKGRFPARYLALCGCALVLLAAVSTGITTSKMRSDAAASDGARAAKFEVTATADNNTSLTLDSTNLECKYAFTVTSESEVTVTYDVIVTLPKELPNGVHMTLGGKSGNTTDGKTYTFSKAGDLKADSEGNTCSHELVFTAEEGMTDVSKLEDITVTVRAEQVD